ncbi:MAG: hypothetical protein WCK28_08115 [Burkholderiales bacterium]|jgi:hypothetical protein
MTPRPPFAALTVASMLAAPLAAGGLAAVLFLCAASPVHAAGGHDLTPKHGGVVVESNDLDVELVARPDRLTLHVRDHGKPVDLKGASGKMTLLAGTEKLEAALAPGDGNTLQAAGAFKVGPGTKAVATLTLPGRKPLVARFVLR